MIQKKTILLLILIISFYSCEKEDLPNPTITTNSPTPSSDFVRYNENNLDNSDQSTIAKFKITHATHNDTDVTDTVMTAGGCTAFYLDNGNLCMVNIWSKDGMQTYGKLYLTEEYKKTKETDVFYKWHYNREYSGREGSAVVKLEKEFKPQGTYYIVTITLLDGPHEFVYSGYCS